MMANKEISAWEKVEIARNPKRKTSLDYIDVIFDEFMELHGDRNFKDDKAICCGLARIGNQNFTVIAEQKGRTTKENIERNFGMPNPESYRKAIRFMKQAEKFKRPVITFIDTKGAYPGIGAEERGQGEAIAKSMFEMAKLKVPTIAIIVGEGSSGGALAIAFPARPRTGKPPCCTPITGSGYKCTNPNHENCRKQRLSGDGVPKC